MVLHGDDQIAERYRLINRIAIGGMGEVWEAKDLRLNRTVAIKVLKPEIGSDPDFLARFRTEAQISASLNHRGIAGVHDYGEGVTPDGSPTAYLVMELVHGEPLSTRLSTRGKLGPVLTLDLLEQTGRGLHAAHSREFVHRDVKPGNILLSEDGTVKLTDFGIAKALSSAPITESGMVMGTAHYIAPEQATGEDASPASDVYSLAVVGYECLVGYRPFQATSPVEVAMMHIHDPVPPLPDDIPPNVRKLIETGLAKDPSRRYRNGGEFAAAAALVRRGQPPPEPGSVVAASTSSVLPAIDTVAQDRHSAAGPSSDGLTVPGLTVPCLAADGLATPGVAPLPGNQGSSNKGGDQLGGDQLGGSRGGGRRTGGSAVPERVGAPSTVERSDDVAPIAPPPEPKRFTPLPSPSRSGRMLMLVTFVLVTIIAVAIGIYVVRSAVRSQGHPLHLRHHHQPPASTSAPTTPGAPPPSAPLTSGGSALVSPAGLLGRAATAVEFDLRNAGMAPSVVSTTNTTPTNPAGATVTGLRPTGTLPKGTAVTITCAQH
jgi:eukaryotic-like serine/threonine-protein kinase